MAQDSVTCTLTLCPQAELDQLGACQGTPACRADPCGAGTWGCPHMGCCPSFPSCPMDSEDRLGGSLRGASPTPALSNSVLSLASQPHRGMARGPDFEHRIAASHMGLRRVLGGRDWCHLCFTKEVLSTAQGSDGPGLRAGWLHLPQVVWTWATDLTSLWLSCQLCVCGR